MTWWLWIIVVVLVVAGIAGTLLPWMPGVPLVFAALLLAAWVDGFAEVSVFVVVVLGVLTLLAQLADMLASALGAERFGASRKAVIGAAIGTVVGIFFGLVGLLLGPFLGAVIGELMTRSDVQRATRAGVGTWVGLLLGTVAKLALAFAMVGVFVAAYLI
ncbi:MAG TPA: DUF456 family protein [Pelomicrobium sp.]|nr:DUF456 family protein [Pelomicrobium sp.]